MEKKKALGKTQTTWGERGPGAVVQDWVRAGGENLEEEEEEYQVEP